ncbi:MAG TPA: hypothetical protein VKE88_03665 [Candidatus Nanoarchaeia archaeon]|nr:hypothetical protein [Candidatus Nanoarchaeia archaeon]
MSLTDTLDARLKKLDPSERSRELMGVYKQVAPSRTKGHQAKGMYREQLESAVIDEKEKLQFISYLVKQLDRNDFGLHAQNVLRHYFPQFLSADKRGENYGIEIKLIGSVPIGKADGTKLIKTKYEIGVESGKPISMFK